MRKLGFDTYVDYTECYFNKYKQSVREAEQKSAQ